MGKQQLYRTPWRGASPPVEKIIAHCAHPKHSGPLTKRRMDEHECLKKQCTSLVKKDLHYFETLERQEQKKRKKKAIRKELSKQKNQEMREFREGIDEFIESKQLPIYVTLIKEERVGIYTVNYIAQDNKRVDLTEFAQALKDYCGKGVYLKQAYAPQENLEQLIKR